MCFNPQKSSFPFLIFLLALMLTDISDLYYSVFLWLCHFIKYKRLASLETLGFPLESEMKLCGFEQCLAAQHKFYND